MWLQLGRLEAPDQSLGRKREDAMTIIKHKKNLLQLAVGRLTKGLLAALIPASMAFGADYEMVIGHLYPEDPTSNEVQPSLLHFEALVESATGGAIDVQVFAGGQLGNEVESGKQVQAGRTMQGTVMSSGAMSSFYKDYQIITTPFLFNDYLTARAYFDGEWHADFMKGAIQESGLRYLGTFDDGGGFVALTTNKRLVKTVEDLAGLKIRVEENPAHVAIMKALWCFCYATALG